MVTDNDAFHQGDFGRQQGARCAVVRVQQAARNAAGGQNRPALRVGRIGAPGALRRLPDARIAPGRPLRTAPTRATRSAPMKCVIISDLWYWPLKNDVSIVNTVGRHRAQADEALH